MSAPRADTAAAIRELEAVLTQLEATARHTLHKDTETPTVPVANVMMDVRFVRERIAALRALPAPSDAPAAGLWEASEFTEAQQDIAIQDFELAVEDYQRTHGSRREADAYSKLCEKRGNLRTMLRTALAQPSRAPQWGAEIAARHEFGELDSAQPSRTASDAAATGAVEPWTYVVSLLPSSGWCIYRSSGGPFVFNFGHDAERLAGMVCAMMNDEMKKPAPDKGAEQRAGAGDDVFPPHGVNPERLAAAREAMRPLNDQQALVTLHSSNKRLYALLVEAERRAAPQPADDAREAAVAAVGVALRYLEWATSEDVFEQAPCVAGFARDKLTEALRLMRTPSAPADARWAMLRAFLVEMHRFWQKQEDSEAADERRRQWCNGKVNAYGTAIDEMDRLAAAPASTPSGEAVLRELRDWTARLTHSPGPIDEAVRWDNGRMAFTRAIGEVHKLIDKLLAASPAPAAADKGAL
jgi:hypothetical protein